MYADPPTCLELMSFYHFLDTRSGKTFILLQVYLLGCTFQRFGVRDMYFVKAHILEFIACSSHPTSVVNCIRFNESMEINF